MAKKLLEIALDHGFSSHEAFTRAFKAAYGVTPSEYRKSPLPRRSRTKINPFDRYFLGLGEIGMLQPTQEIKCILSPFPPTKFFAHRKLREQRLLGFLAKANLIPGQDQETICGLLDSIKGKLDDAGGSEVNASSGQLMAYISDPASGALRLGLSPHRVLWRAPSRGLQGARPAALCSWPTFPRPNTSFLNTARSITSRENRTVEEAGWKRRCPRSIFRAPAAVSTLPRQGSFTSHFDPDHYWKYIRPVRRLEG